MSKFIVEENYQGYVRGTRTYIVEAESKEEALEIYQRFEYEDDIIRDDTDTTDIECKEE